jgi:hypothetical protein
MSAEPRCWLCSAEIPPTERPKTLGDLDVSVHGGCFERLFETRGPKSWSDAPAESSDPPESGRRVSGD